MRACFSDSFVPVKLFSAGSSPNLLGLCKRGLVLVLAPLLMAFSCQQTQTAETTTTVSDKPTAAITDTAVAAPATQPDTAAINAVPDSATTSQPDTAKAPVAVADPEQNLSKTEKQRIRDSLAVSPSPVVGPELLPGSILPKKRIVAYYGNPHSKRMGILGEIPVDQMLAKLDGEVAAWEKADPSTPVQPALHLVAVTAQGHPGKDGMYRLRMSNATIEKVIDWAKRRDALVFLDVQVGRSTLQQELPRLEKYLQLPQVHLGVDAEFAMGETGVPGRKIGSFDAPDLNYASGFLAGLVDKYNIPPKVFVIHRFTHGMIKNSSQIKLDPRVQIVMHMDGWGDKPLKRDSYWRYIVKQPVQYTGFKLFYKNDVRKPGWQLMTPHEILRLRPKPVYIQYQ